MKGTIIVLGLAAYSGLASAAWLATLGKVQSVTSYTHTDTVLFTLIAGGQPVVYGIDGSVPEGRRKQLIAALMSAQARAADVVVTHDDTACVAWDADHCAFPAVVRLTTN